MAIKGTISHQGFTAACPCGNTQDLICKTHPQAAKEAQDMGWRNYRLSGWTCPACSKKYAGEVSGDALALSFTEEIPAWTANELERGLDN